MSYSMILLSIADFRFRYVSLFGKILKDFLLTNEDFEYLYDWMVREGLSQTLQLRFGTARVYEHYRHDVYKYIYDYYGQYIQSVLEHEIKNHNLDFLKNQVVKCMVAADTLIIAKGTLHV